MVFIDIGGTGWCFWCFQTFQSIRRLIVIILVNCINNSFEIMKKARCKLYLLFESMTFDSIDRMMSQADLSIERKVILQNENFFFQFYRMPKFEKVFYKKIKQTFVAIFFIAQIRTKAFFLKNVRNLLLTEWMLVRNISRLFFGFFVNTK